MGNLTVDAAIWHCLNHYDYTDAIFLAERYRAEVDSDEMLFLLATCYYRSGKPSQAYTILQSKGTKSAQCKFLLAKCCLDLNKLLEAEYILTGGNALKPGNLEYLTDEFKEHSAFALQLIAKICYRTERPERAAEACRQALELNPLLWSSFELLCNRGEKPDPNGIFQPAFLSDLSNCYGTANQVVNTLPSCCSDGDLGHDQVVNNKLRTPAQAISNTSQISKGGQFTSGKNSSQTKPEAPMKIARLYKRHYGGNITPLTPNFGVLPLETPSPRKLANRQAPLRMIPSSLSTLTENKNQDNVANILTNSGLISSIPAVASPSQPTQNVRRSPRISCNSAAKENKGLGPNETPKSPSCRWKINKVRKTNKAPASTKIEEKSNEGSMPIVEMSTIVANGAQTLVNLQKPSVEGLMQVLRQLGEAYAQLAQYNCRKAIECLKSLPSQHFNTGFILSLMGRAYFELSQYQNCIKYFQRVRELEPHRDSMMEVYSTALWHLPEEVELSALAQELVALDKESVATWCVVGNCFSTQNDHDTAIKFFQRAIQVDPNFAYAHTLLGHEYVAIDKLDKALNCFRSAIRFDPRHYNAWFGIGTIFFKQKKYWLCEIHYKRAIQCNPSNSVLLCHMGVVQNALQKTSTAIETLTNAIQIDPANVQCRFKRAELYFATGRHTEALIELGELKERIPKELQVHLLTGKVHQELGNIDLARMYFSWVPDFDPEGVKRQFVEAVSADDTGHGEQGY